MSSVQIRAALESALNAMSPSLDTAWENVQHTPPSASTAYQVVNLLFARPDNSEIGSSHQELGYLQVKLMYPLQTGPAAAAARAELLRTTFARGNSFTSGGVTVSITETPEILPAQIEDSRYAVIVRIRFRSFIPN